VRCGCVIKIICKLSVSDLNPRMWSFVDAVYGDIISLINDYSGIKRRHIKQLLKIVNFILDLKNRKNANVSN